MADAPNLTPSETPGAALSPEAPAAISSAPDQPGGAEPVAGETAAATEPSTAAAATGDETSLLEAFDAEKAEKAATDPLAPDAGKPEESAAPTEAKPEGETAPAEPAVPAELPPVEYKYEIPETLTLSDEAKSELHSVFDDFRRDPAANGQKLIDLHAREMGRYAEQVAQQQLNVWNQTRKDWRTQVLADVELGGAGHQTAMSEIARMRDLGVSSAKPGTDKYNQDKAEFDHFLRATGAGDHPAFLRLLRNLADRYGEPLDVAAEGIKPPPNHGQNPNSKRGVIYDHPRSPGNRQ